MQATSFNIVSHVSWTMIFSSKGADIKEEAFYCNDTYHLPEARVIDVFKKAVAKHHQNIQPGELINIIVSVNKNISVIPQQINNQKISTITQQIADFIAEQLKPLSENIKSSSKKIAGETDPFSSLCFHQDTKKLIQSRQGNGVFYRIGFQKCPMFKPI